MTIEKTGKSHWEKLGAGTVRIMPRKVGKSGKDLPDMQILLPDNQRMSIWLNQHKGTASWQHLQDTAEYREYLESSFAQQFNANKPAEAPAEDNDDLPF